MVLAATGDGEHADTQVHRVLLEEPATLELGHRPQRVQANVAGSGFYRTFTDPALRAALAADTSASALERFVLLDDTVAGHLAGRVAAGEVLELVERLAVTESDPSVWRRIASATHELVRLAGTAHDGAVRAAIVALATPALARFDLLAEPAAPPKPAGRRPGTSRCAPCWCRCSASTDETPPPVHAPGRCSNTAARMRR